MIPDIMWPSGPRTVSRPRTATADDEGEIVMSTNAEIRAVRRAMRHELEAIRGQWVWLLVLGIAMIVLGTFAIAAPLIASLATALTFGVLLLVGGIGQLIGAFWTRDWSGF